MLGQRKFGKRNLPTSMELQGRGEHRLQPARRADHRSGVSGLMPVPASRRFGRTGSDIVLDTARSKQLFRVEAQIDQHAVDAPCRDYYGLQNSTPCKQAMM